MFNEVISSNPPDLLIPVEGAYVWNLEVIVVVVRIDPVSHEYEIAQLLIPPVTKKNKIVILITHIIPKHDCYNN